jgi:hypothetical protein
LEDIATSPVPDGTDPTDVLEVLAAIDAAPVAYRAELGADMLQSLSDPVGKSNEEMHWWIRQMSWDDRPHLMFAVANRLGRDVQDAFNAYVQLRHQQYRELISERGERLSAGILLTPRFDQVRAWDTTLAATRGDQQFGPEFRAALEDLWGAPGTSKRP